MEVKQMELEKIKGNTNLIFAPTNVGVYTFKNKNCLLIDTGINNAQGKRIDEIVTAAGLHPKYICNTHSHTDHCGANSHFLESYPGCQVYTSAIERVYMETPGLLAAILYSGFPMSGIEPERSSRPLRVDFTLEPGTCKFGDEKFEVISLPGHTNGQIGLITPDRVCFLGDAIFCAETIEKYTLPYLFNIDVSIKTIKKLREIDADFFVLSHAARIYDRCELDHLIDINLSNLAEVERQMLELLEQPISREGLVENLTVYNEIALNLMEYHIIFGVVSSYLTYLYRKGLIDYSINDGNCYYFRKPE